MEIKKELLNQHLEALAAERNKAAAVIQQAQNIRAEADQRIAQQQANIVALEAKIKLTNDLLRHLEVPEEVPLGSAADPDGKR